MRKIPMSLVGRLLPDESEMARRPIFVLKCDANQYPSGATFRTHRQIPPFQSQLLMVG